MTSTSLSDEVRPPVTVSITGDYDVVCKGVAAMVSPYAGRVRLVESRCGGDRAPHADLVLYDCFSGQHPAADEGLGCVAGSIVYTWAVGEELVSSALAAGARGYLSKRLPAEDLVRDLERIGGGEVVVDLGGSPLIAMADAASRAEEGVHLSARETQVLVLIASGLSNQEIAAQCYLSINSVKTYIRSTYRKIGVTSRALAVLWALEHGLASVASSPTVHRPEREPRQPSRALVDGHDDAGRL